jgi:hypothetical protein
VRDRVIELRKEMTETPGEHVRRITDELKMNKEDFGYLVQIPMEKVESLLSDTPTKFTSDEARSLYYFTDMDFDVWIYHEDIVC